MLGRMRQAKGQWSVSEYFSRCGAAKAWGRRPSELGLCHPEQDAALMIAYERALSDMAGAERFENERKNKPKKAKR